MKAYFGKTFSTECEIQSFAAKNFGKKDAAVIRELIILASDRKKNIMKPHFGWLKDFRQNLISWSKLFGVAELIQTEVKKNGLSTKTAARCNRKVSELLDKEWPDTRKSIEEYFRQETKGMTADEILPGTSDPVESIFTKFKNMVSRNPLREIGSAFLHIPAFTQRATTDMLKNVLRVVKLKQIDDWAADESGPSIMSKKRAMITAMK